MQAQGDLGLQSRRKRENQNSNNKETMQQPTLPNGINTQINSVRIDEILPKGYESQVRKHHILKS